MTRAGRRGRAAAPGVRAHRRGAAQGLPRGDRAVPRPRRRRGLSGDALLERVRGDRAAAGRRGRCVVLLSGGRDSVCLLDVAVRSPGATRSARCTSTTGCAARRPAATRRTAAALCARPRRRRCVVERAGAAPAHGQPAGLGARRALRGAAPGSRRARRAGRRRAHAPPTRPRRSSTGSRVAGAARAARAWRRATGRLVRPLLGVTREETAAWCRGARAGLARGRHQRRSDVYARGRVRDGAGPGAARRSHPAAEATSLRTAELLRDEAEVLDERRRRRRSPGATAIALEQLRRAAAGARAARRAAAGRGRRRARLCPRAAGAPGRRPGAAATGRAGRRRRRPRGRRVGVRRPRASSARRRRAALTVDSPADARPRRSARSSSSPTSCSSASASSGAQITERLRRARPAARRRAQGRGVLPLGPDARRSTSRARSTSWPSPPTARRPTPAASCGSSRTSTPPIEGRDVLIVEDIVDSGLTLQYLLRNLGAREPGLARGLRAARPSPSAARSSSPIATSASRSPTGSRSGTGSTTPSATATCRTWRR